MNCKKCQESIFDALAAGTGDLPPEVAAHQKSCLACAKFSAVQQTLFQSINAGLQSLVNQPAPASLLPTVRARLDENCVRQPSGLLTWSLAVVTSLAVAAVILGHFWLRPTAFPNSPQQPTKASQADPVRQEAPQDAQHLNLRSRSIFRASARHKTAPPSPATSEVIVLAEEREAFAKFVAEAPEQPQVAAAITHPAPAASDTPIEIALLHIERIQLKPLDPTATE
jgi:hypothetical protein